MCSRPCGMVKLAPAGRSRCSRHEGKKGFGSFQSFGMWEIQFTETEEYGTIGSKKYDNERMRNTSCSLQTERNVINKR